MTGMSNPTRSNPAGSNAELPEANAPLHSAHHPGIHQSNSLSPYHQHQQHHAPSGPGYYYNYNPPPHPHEQQPHGSPIPIQQQQQRYSNGLHPSAYTNNPYHHSQQGYRSQYDHHSGQHGPYHHQHCSYGGVPPSASATDAWPAPPSSFSSEEIAKMDTANEGNEDQRHGASSTLCRSHPQGVATAATAVLEEDTSNLATLANASMASMSHSPPPHASSSSASSSTPSPPSSPTTARGPLKKRRKVEEHVTTEEKDAAAAVAKSKASDMSGKKKVLDCEGLFVVRSMDSSNSAMSTNTKNNIVGFSNNDSAPSDSRLKSWLIVLHKLLTKGNDPERENNGKVQMENKGSGDAATDNVELSIANASASSVANDAISLAMEWLPHGKGFRILRWGALCTILPKVFPQLCEDADLSPIQLLVQENTEKKFAKEEAVNRDVITEGEMEEEHKVEFSNDQWIEAFLWHTQVWGFTEVKTGVDRASFRHESFLRESPELCLKMKRSNHSGHASCKKSSKRLCSSNGSVHGTELSYTTSSDPHDQTSVDTAARSSSWRNKHHTNKNISSIFKPRSIYSASTTHLGCPQQQPQQHPSYLHVPTLTSCATASFSNDATHYWAGGGNNNEHHTPHPDTGKHHDGHQNDSYRHPPPPQQQQHAHYVQYLAPPPPPPPSYPTPPMRSPKTIRFRDDITESYHHTSDVAVEITPNPDDHLQGGKEAPSSQPLLLSRGTNSGNKQQPHGRSTSLRGTVSRRGRRPALISRHATN